jgi:hypothetical protein
MSGDLGGRVKISGRTWRRQIKCELLVERETRFERSPGRARLRNPPESLDLIASESLG